MKLFIWRVLVGGFSFGINFTKVEGSTDVAVLFIGESWNSFLGGVFIVHPAYWRFNMSYDLCSGDTAELYHFSVFHTLVLL